jgi:AcrR family transcriptional regulator
MSGVVADGRNARRARNRDAVLDAVLDLFREGELVPDVAKVAERSGVSERSVFRYFADTDALVRAAIARQHERVGELYELDSLGDGPVADRIDRLVDQRLTLHDAVAPTARAALLRAADQPLIREQVERRWEHLRRQTEAQLAPELREMAPGQRRAVAGAADVLCQLESLDHLRRHRGMSKSACRAVLVRSLRALVGVEQP